MPNRYFGEPVDRLTLECVIDNVSSSQVADSGFPVAPASGAQDIGVDPRAPTTERTQ